MVLFMVSLYVGMFIGYQVGRRARVKSQAEAKSWRQMYLAQAEHLSGAVATKPKGPGQILQFTKPKRQPAQFVITDVNPKGGSDYEGC